MDIPRPSAALISDTLGAFEIGVVISIFLFGILTLQTFQYYNLYETDEWYLKTFVFATWTLEAAHTSVIVFTLYDYTVTNFGQNAFLGDAPPEMKIMVLLSGIIIASVQSFFAWRIRVISQRWTIPIACWLLTAARFVSITFITAIAFQMELSTFIRRYEFLVEFSLISGVINDLIIPLALVYYLSRIKLKSERKSTNRVITSVIVFSVETGLISGAVVLVELITILVLPKSFIWLAVMVVVAKIYSNSLMVSLNSRLLLRSQLYNSATETLQFRRCTAAGSNDSSHVLTADHILSINPIADHCLENIYHESDITDQKPGYWGGAV